MQQRIYTNTRGKKIGLLSRNHQSYDPTFILFDCGRDDGIDSWLERKTYHLKTGQIVKNELMTIPLYLLVHDIKSKISFHTSAAIDRVLRAQFCVFLLSTPPSYSTRFVSLTFDL
uniref:Uncharacterized protein n=1 Tax=Octactis speculum TaxID=3111310 RepID=A0A7S2FAR9_9STRA